MNAITELNGLVKNEKLSRIFNCPNLFIKDESQNPYGTYKDRRSQLIVEKALHDKVDKLVLITSGNAGYSLGKFCKNTGIKVACMVDQSLSVQIVSKLQSVCDQVIPVDLSKCILKPEDVMSLVRESETEVIREVTNGYSTAYERIIDEIAETNPAFIVCPVGNGEAFVGLYDALNKYSLPCKLVGVTPLENPSFADKLFTLWSPYTAKLNMIMKQGHLLFRVSEEEIHHTFEKVKDILVCEPSSAIVFSVLSRLSNDKKIVVINSGRGLT